jgi:seryl-tRNA synthetase
MHDIKAIRDNPEAFEAAWSAKGRSGAAAEAVKLDAQLRAARRRCRKPRPSATTAPS